MATSSLSVVARGKAAALVAIERECLKRVVNTLNRIERVLIPDFEQNHIARCFAEYADSAKQQGKYLVDIVINAQTQRNMRDIDWNLLEYDIHRAFREHSGSSLLAFPAKAQSEIDRERNIQVEEIDRLRSKEFARSLQINNRQPSVPGKWRKEPYPIREYERIENYITTDTISDSEAAKCLEQLDTPLYGFLGQAYNFDDHDITEDWMLNFKDDFGRDAVSDDDIIRTQLSSLLDIIVSQVQDRVCTASSILQVPPVGLGEQIKERLVWGIDCYTRRMVELVIDDYYTSRGLRYNDGQLDSFSMSTVPLPSVTGEICYGASGTIGNVVMDNTGRDYGTMNSTRLVDSAEATDETEALVYQAPTEIGIGSLDCLSADTSATLTTGTVNSNSKENSRKRRKCSNGFKAESSVADMGYEINPSLAKGTKKFVERCLLPAINAQSSDKAHNMWFAASSIKTASRIVDEVHMANAILQAVEMCGLEYFKIHPKGTGLICTAPQGIKPHTVVSEYLGEMYPPYRWCEKLDVVEQAQKKFGLRPTLPDFYNILLERPRQDPRGYGLLFVDASQKANLGSSCSHSCESNCTSAVVAKNGRLAIVLTTNRCVHPGTHVCSIFFSFIHDHYDSVRAQTPKHAFRHPNIHTQAKS